LAPRGIARLVVLGCFHPLAVPVGVVPTFPVGVAEEVEREFEAALARAAAGARVDADPLMLTGLPGSSLAQASADVDLLVAGSRAYGAIKGVVLGSVSRYLVDHAHCPVLVVPRPSSDD
jgi:nucleotide-binding universal stress UspA family protein